MKTALALLLLFLGISSTVWGRRDFERERERHERGRRREAGRRFFEDLEPREPRETLRTDGGRVEVWDAEDYEALKDADLAAARMTLKPHSLMLPNYADIHRLAYVIRGSGRLGIIPPFGDRVIQNNVYKARQGDVVAIPKGVSVWWYNDGEEEMEIVGIADTISGTEPGRYRIFFLAGGEDEHSLGSVLHGFSEDILSKAWNVDRDTVSELLESQNGTGIIRVREDLHLPEASEENYNGYFNEFVYHLHAADPDVRVRDGGSAKLVTSDKLSVLRLLHLGLACVRLKPNALFAPSWSHNAHEVIYVVNGSATIQIVRHNGDQALDTELKEGSLLVIPRFFPSAKLAGDDGFAYISFLSHERPAKSFLAGSNSVFKGIPEQVVARALNIDEEVERDIRDRRRDEAIIFPPSSSSRRRRHRREEPLIKSVVGNN